MAAVAAMTPVFAAGAFGGWIAPLPAPLVEGLLLLAAFFGVRCVGWVRGSRRAVEVVIALVVVVVAGETGQRYVQVYSRSQQPEFYQSYYEPAVLLACGYGFRVTAAAHRGLAPELAGLEEFLLLERDRFDCEELPGELSLADDRPVQSTWFYLLSTVGLYWRFAGISWSGLAPLLGGLHGLSMAAVYGLLRLAMGRALALCGAMLVSFSSFQLENLPHLRDYAKAPFLLWLLLLLGLLVTRRVRRRSLLGLAAIYGAVLGVGYGFRPDVLIAAPAFIAVVVLFLPGSLRARLPLKAAALAVFLTAFAAVAWPMLSYVRDRGGCQWHVLLIGLQDRFTRSLGVVPSFYDWGAFNADGYVDTIASSHARRVFGADDPVYCSPDYDRATRDLFLRIAVAFPADMATRALASALTVLEAGVSRPRPPPGLIDSSFYAHREAVIGALAGVGLPGMTIALLAIGARHLRLGLLVMTLWLYFAGYPSLQFDGRHYFHLEFVTWWALGAVVQAVLAGVAHARSARAFRLKHRAAAATRLLAAAVALGLLFAGLRVYQGASVARLVRSHLDAPRTPVELRARLGDGTTLLESLEPRSALTPQRRSAGDVLIVGLGGPDCAGRDIPVTFRFDAGFGLDLSRTLWARGGARAEPPARVVAPVYHKYSSFLGLELPTPLARCVTGVQRVTDLSGIPLLLYLDLPTGWELDPHHQSLRHP